MSVLIIEYVWLEDVDDYVCYGYGWIVNVIKILVIIVDVIGKSV